MPVDVQGPASSGAASSQSRDRSPAHFSGRHRDSGRPACAADNGLRERGPAPTACPTHRGVGTQLLDGLDAAQRHVGQQDDHVQRAVVAAQLNKAIVEMSKQAILRQGWQARHAAKGDVAAGLEMGRGSIQKTDAARTRWSGRVHAVPISAAASSTARVDLSVAMGGWRAAALSGAVAPGSSGPGSVSRPCWNALRSVSSLRPRCSATSLRLQPAPATVVPGR